MSCAEKVIFRVLWPSFMCLLVFCSGVLNADHSFVQWFCWSFWFRLKNWTGKMFQ